MTATLLDDAAAFVRRYVVLASDAQAITIALWILHTWAFPGAHATPYLTILSPEKRTGKTRLLEVLELLVRSPWRVSSASEAAMYRKIQVQCPTLLLDEVDAIFSVDTPRNEGLRAILNSGTRAGSSVSVCVGPLHEVKEFSTFCPKVLAGIDNGEIPETIRDRSIDIRMQRRTAGEHVERFRYRKAAEQTTDFAISAGDWADATAAELHDAEPDLPEALNDRMADAWEPLFAIADLAGDEWARAARAAALELSAADDAEDASHGTRVLAAMRAALNGDITVSSTDLLEAINADEEMPFGAWRDGRGLDSRGLARLLKPYGIKPKVVRLTDGSTPRGYHRDDLSPVWARYLDPPVVADVADVAPLSDADGEVVPLDLYMADALPAQTCKCDRPLAAVDAEGSRSCVNCGRAAA